MRPRTLFVRVLGSKAHGPQAWPAQPNYSGTLSANWLGILEESFLTDCASQETDSPQASWQTGGRALAASLCMQALHCLPRQTARHVFKAACDWKQPTTSDKVSFTFPCHLGAWTSIEAEPWRIPEVLNFWARSFHNHFFVIEATATIHACTSVPMKASCAWTGKLSLWSQRSWSLLKGRCRRIMRTVLERQCCPHW